MSESIKSGQQYHITNEENGLSFYLYLDDKVVVGWGFRDEERQRWIIERQNDSQWTIQSVKFQKYLGFENVPKDGSPVVCLDKPPHLWDIEIQPDSEEDDYTRVKFWVRGTHLVVEYPKDSRDLRLWEAQDGKNQVWVLRECS